MTTEKQIKKHTDDAVQEIKILVNKLVQQAPGSSHHNENHIDATTINENLEVITDHICKVELENDEVKDENSTLEINNDRLRETIEKRDNEIERKRETINELNDEVQNYKDKAFLPSKTLDDENKNKILAELHHNLSIFDLDNLLVLAKANYGKYPWKETL